MRRTRFVVNLKQCDGDLGLQPTSEVSRKDNHNKYTVGMPTWALKSKYGIWTQTHVRHECLGWHSRCKGRVSLALHTTRRL